MVTRFELSLWTLDQQIDFIEGVLQKGSRLWNLDEDSLSEETGHESQLAAFSSRADSVRKTSVSTAIVSRSSGAGASRQSKAYAHTHTHTHTHT